MSQREPIEKDLRKRISELEIDLNALLRNEFPESDVVFVVTEKPKPYWDPPVPPGLWGGVDA